MKILFSDLRMQHDRLRLEIEAAIAEVFDASSFIKGPALKCFEDEFAQYCHAQGCVGTSSGTAALHVTLAALDISKGDEVVLPAHTFVATAEAVLHCGAVPVFADIDPATYTLDPRSLERCLSKKTRAVIPVHIYGQMADMQAIAESLTRFSPEAVIIEDAAQAHGASQAGLPPGGVGKAACFSFFPGKNLGAPGDGGAVVANDRELLHKVRKLCDHGRQEKYTHDLPGFNYRLDTLKAAVLRVKLKHLDEWNLIRRSRAQLYSELLSGVDGVITPQKNNGNIHSYHLYVIQVDRRDELRAFLEERGIATGIHYPVPLHRQPVFQHVAYRLDSLPVTERLCDKILSLPLFPELSEDEVCRVADEIKHFIRR